MRILDNNTLTIPQDGGIDWQGIVGEGAAILLDKPRDWTSFDVVAKMRGITHIRKIGHCGTLDPFATGLLILCIGKATKQIYTFSDLPKQYFATLKLGATTKTLDIESEEENITDISFLDSDAVSVSVGSFVGKLEQIPPMYSAKKVGGKRLYELARKGIEVERKAVDVEIFGIEILDISLPYVTILVDCSKGTYIRALARDIGNVLCVGGYLTALRRTKIGEYDVENALVLADL